MDKEYTSYELVAEESDGSIIMSFDLFNTYDDTIKQLEEIKKQAIEENDDLKDVTFKIYKIEKTLINKRSL